MFDQPPFLHISIPRCRRPSLRPSCHFRNPFFYLSSRLLKDFWHLFDLQILLFRFQDDIIYQHPEQFVYPLLSLYIHPWAISKSTTSTISPTWLAIIHRRKCRARRIMLPALLLSMAKNLYLLGPTVELRESGQLAMSPMAAESSKALANQPTAYILHTQAKTSPPGRGRTEITSPHHLISWTRLQQALGSGNVR